MQWQKCKRKGENDYEKRRNERNEQIRSNRKSQMTAGFSYLTNLKGDCK